jgi:hypothetical protein
MDDISILYLAMLVMVVLVMSIGGYTYYKFNNKLTALDKKSSNVVIATRDLLRPGQIITLDNTNPKYPNNTIYPAQLIYWIPSIIQSTYAERNESIPPIIKFRITCLYTDDSRGQCGGGHLKLSFAFLKEPISPGSSITRDIEGCKFVLDLPPVWGEKDLNKSTRYYSSGILRVPSSCIKGTHQHTYLEIEATPNTDKIDSNYSTPATCGAGELTVKGKLYNTFQIGDIKMEILL